MKKLPKYGLMPDDFSLLEYNSRDYYSLGRVSKILESPWAYVDRYVLKNKTKQTDAMKLGIMIHEALLEPEKFKDNYVLMPTFSGTGSVKARKEWKEANSDKHMVDEKTLDKLTCMLSSLTAHKKASNILTGGQAEIQAMVRDDENDLNHYGRFDYLRDDGIFVDVKSCLNASKEAFEKSFYDMGYYLQCGYYALILELMTGKQCNEAMFICVETKMPYNVAVYHVNEVSIDLGKSVIKKSFEEYNKWIPLINKAYDLREKIKDPQELRIELLKMFPQINEGKILPANLPYWSVSKIEEKYGIKA